MGVVVAGFSPEQLAELGIGECGRHLSGFYPAADPRIHSGGVAALRSFRSGLLETE
jgi:hypothetical protein